jgi:PRC-barrel domain
VVVGDQDLHGRSIVHAVNANDAAGEPISYMALEEGTEVRSCDGERIGTVAHVLADVEDDIFDGIVIDASHLPSGHVFADADEVGEIRTGAVTLKLDVEECRTLPQPSENPAAMEAGPEDTVKQDKLRRAWDYLSGNY